MLWKKRINILLYCCVNIYINDKNNLIKEKYIKLANVALNYPKSYISTKEKSHSEICCVSLGDSNDKIILIR